MSALPAYAYTLVAYRPNGVDTCRGCVMGRSDSDFWLSVHTSAEDVAAEWAQSLFKESQNQEREVCSIEYTLLVDGRDENNDRCWTPDGDLDPAHTDPDSGESYASLARDQVQKLVSEKLTELKTAHQAELDQKAAQEAARRQREAIQARRAADEHERAEYLRLSAKFGGTSK
jgi:hypothetical protein